MTISINNPVQATYIFIAIFLAVTIASVRRRRSTEIFPAETSQELKGLSILAVVFSHVGYFLVSDTRFLFPLTIIAGVGVNMFLFLSGYGLATSALKKEMSAWQFYRRRLLKLFIPFWLVLAAFFSLDFFLLKISYGWAYISRSLAGFFPRADLYRDVDSPLWYFTFILFYYLVFPLVFSRKRPWISAIIIYAVAYLIIQRNPAELAEVMHLYKVHIMAFPLGVLAAGLSARPQIFQALSASTMFVGLKNSKAMKMISYYVLASALSAIAVYTAYHSNVGRSPWLEEITSIITVLAITALFMMKKFEIRLWYLFGVYSYEVYLLHWPIMYRYDFLFKAVPAWLAIAGYLAVFIGLGWLVKKISEIDFFAKLK